MDKYDKIIYACNNDDCIVEYLHILVRSNQSVKYTEDIVVCPSCNIEMVFCELIEEAGDL